MCQFLNALQQLMLLFADDAVAAWRNWPTFRNLCSHKIHYLLSYYKTWKRRFEAQISWNSQSRKATRKGEHSGKATNLEIRFKTWHIVKRMKGWEKYGSSTPKRCYWEINLTVCFCLWNLLHSCNYFCHSLLLLLLVLQMIASNSNDSSIFHFFLLATIIECLTLQIWQT